MSYIIQVKDKGSKDWSNLDKFANKAEADRKHSWYTQYGGSRSFRVVKG